MLAPVWTRQTGCSVLLIRKPLQLPRRFDPNQLVARLFPFSLTSAGLRLILLPPEKTSCLS
jgi:hypothetical protein